MNRRNFLSGLGALMGGLALEQVPLGRVWSFPTDLAGAARRNHAEPRALQLHRDAFAMAAADFDDRTGLYRTGQIGDVHEAEWVEYLKPGDVISFDVLYGFAPVRPVQAWRIKDDGALYMPDGRRFFPPASAPENSPGSSE